jgi:hypothetical protein
MFSLEFLSSRPRKNGSKPGHAAHSSGSAHDERVDAKLTECFRQVELAPIARHHDVVGLKSIKDMSNKKTRCKPSAHTIDKIGQHRNRAHSFRGIVFMKTIALLIEPVIPYLFQHVIFCTKLT